MNLFTLLSDLGSNDLNKSTNPAMDFYTDTLSVVLK